jgi:hypothetical protein
MPIWRPPQRKRIETQQESRGGAVRKYKTGIPLGQNRAQGQEIQICIRFFFYTHLASMAL